MTAPLVTKLQADHTRLSHVDGYKEAKVTLAFNQDIQEITVISNGSDHLTGNVIETHKAKTVGDMANQRVSIESTITNKDNIVLVGSGIDFKSIVIDDKEILVGDNVVNFYGKNLSGEWSIKSN